MRTAFYGLTAVALAGVASVAGAQSGYYDDYTYGVAHCSGT
jgi:hypothetical protein